MIGVLVMAYGGPGNLDDVEPYLMDVRGYRPTAPEIVNEVRERYREIGGRSPILEQTRAQAAALESALNRRGSDFRAYVGMRHWRPFIKDALVEMQAGGVDRAVGLVMAPHYSGMSVAAYYKKIDEAGLPVSLAKIEDWHLMPGYLDALTDNVRSALGRFPPEVRADTPIIFTAHSLPQRILDSKDPYPDQLRETVEAVMLRLGSHPHEFAFQSAAISTEPWLGPDAGEVIKRLAGEGQRNILLCPIGFISEHVEILYDVDIVYQRLARSLDVRLERTAMLQVTPKMIDGLAALVRTHARQAGWL
jgi:protoporphyrin/coproporphyrin ferrochelatase